MTRGTTCFLISLVLLVAQWSRAIGSPLIDLEATTSDASLVAISREGAPIFQIGNEQRPVPLDSFARWGSLPAMPGGPVVILRDGGQLSGEMRSGNQQTLQIESPLFGEVAIPRSQIKAVLPQAPFDYTARDRLVSRIIDRQLEGDSLLLDNGDELAGSIEQVKDDAILLQSQVGPTPIELQRVVALAFGSLPGDAAAGTRQLIVGFGDGSWISANRLAPASAGSGRIEVEATAGWKFEASVQDVVYLQSFANEITYVGQLTPSSYRHIPFLKLDWPYAVDRSVAGGLLRHGDQVIPTGIGMHSTSRLTYDLNPDDRLFQAELALDASTGTRGSVTYRVFVDNEQRYASPIVRGGDPPTPITVDVTGGRRLSLIVDFAERGDEMDRANWLNARLTR